MELNSLNGKIIGVINNNINIPNYGEKLVREIITKKVSKSLRMIKLDESILDKKFNELSSRNKSKVILASRLLDKVIVLDGFTKGLIKQDIEYFKKLFKKISEYDRKIVIVDNNTEMFIDLVDNIYVINNDVMVYHTTDIYDAQLELYSDIPKIVKFTIQSSKLGVRIQQYKELDELLKAIYRIKA